MAPRAEGAVMLFSAASASAAFFSCMTPTAAFKVMTAKMTMASGSPSPSMKYMTSENTMAMKSMMTMMSESCSPIMRQTLLRLASWSVFLPYFSRRFAASSSLSPSSDVPSAAQVSSADSECHARLWS